MVHTSPRKPLQGSVDETFWKKKGEEVLNKKNLVAVGEFTRTREKIIYLCLTYCGHGRRKKRVKKYIQHSRVLFFCSTKNYYSHKWTAVPRSISQNLSLIIHPSTFFYCIKFVDRRILRLWKYVIVGRERTGRRQFLFREGGLISEAFLNPRLLHGIA